MCVCSCISYIATSTVTLLVLPSEAQGGISDTTIVCVCVCVTNPRLRPTEPSRSPRLSGEDGKKFKTRSGETVKLSELLAEAVRIAGDTLRNRRIEEEEKTKGSPQARKIYCSSIIERRTNWSTVMTCKDSTPLVELS